MPAVEQERRLVHLGKHLLPLDLLRGAACVRMGLGTAALGSVIRCKTLNGTIVSVFRATQVRMSCWTPQLTPRVRQTPFASACMFDARTRMLHRGKNQRRGRAHSHEGHEACCNAAHLELAPLYTDARLDLLHAVIMQILTWSHSVTMGKLILAPRCHDEHVTPGPTL